HYCLQWQDERSIDVCVLLSLLWVAARGGEFAEADILALDSVAADWRRGVTAALRTARRQAKTESELNPSAAECYEHLKNLELATERHTLAQMQVFIEGRRSAQLSSVTSVADMRSAVVSMLRQYLSQNTPDATLTSAVQDAMGQLLDGLTAALVDCCQD
ncbi:TIGR02444 family protein, partial [bacterium]|nr:TIGR02444 family protein [bacterium]